MAEAPPYRVDAARAAALLPLLRALVAGDAGTAQTRRMTQRPTARCFWAPRAWLAGGWHEQRAAARRRATGCWAEISAGVLPPPGAQCSPGRCCPASSMPTAMPSSARWPAWPSGARRGEDDFWSWRDRMYGVALRITPEQLRAVAAQLYVELLRGGYTQVCEFHYLQHRAGRHAPTPTR